MAVVKAGVVPNKVVVGRVVLARVVPNNKVVVLGRVVPNNVLGRVALVVFVVGGTVVDAAETVWFDVAFVVLLPSVGCCSYRHMYMVELFQNRWHSGMVSPSTHTNTMECVAW